MTLLSEVLRVISDVIMQDVFIISHLFCKIPKTPDVVCVNEDL